MLDGIVDDTLIDMGIYQGTVSEGIPNLTSQNQNKTK